LKSTSSNNLRTQQLNKEEAVNFQKVYRALLRIIAHLDETQYTRGMLRQITEQELDDLADPASAANTSQG
jgi:uncharacterized protein YjiS (DUF1127 family)